MYIPSVCILHLLPQIKRALTLFHLSILNSSPFYPNNWRSPHWEGDSRSYIRIQYNIHRWKRIPSQLCLRMEKQKQLRKCTRNDLVPLPGCFRTSWSHFPIKWYVLSYLMLFPPFVSSSISIQHWIIRG